MTHYQSEAKQTPSSEQARTLIQVLDKANFFYDEFRHSNWFTDLRSANKSDAPSREEKLQEYKAQLVSDAKPFEDDSFVSDVVAEFVNLIDALVDEWNDFRKWRDKNSAERQKASLLPLGSPVNELRDRRERIDETYQEFYKTKYVPVRKRLRQIGNKALADLR
jgi:putative protein kinase ArgK-like GTPase of G3E family